MSIPDSIGAIQEARSLLDAAEETAESDYARDEVNVAMQRLRNALEAERNTHGVDA